VLTTPQIISEQQDKKELEMIQISRAKFWDLTGTQLLKKLDIHNMFGVYAKIQANGLLYHVVQRRDNHCRSYVEVGVDFDTGRAIFRGGQLEKVGTYRNTKFRSLLG